MGQIIDKKTARIISTLDQPACYYWLVYRQPSVYAMKKLTLEFSGIKPVKVTTIGAIKVSKRSYREDWLGKIEKIGQHLK